MRGMGAGIMDTLSKIGGNAGGIASGIQAQGEQFQQKLSEGVDIAENYAIAQLVLQGIATFAAVGMLHLYKKTYDLHARKMRVHNNPRRRRTRRNRR